MANNSMFDTIMKSNVHFTAANKCNVVINGKMLTYGGKRVIMRYSGGDIHYYVKNSTRGDGGDSNRTEIEGFGKTIQELLESPSFFGVDTFSVPISAQNLDVKVDTAMGIIFIESSLYSAIKNLIMARPFAYRVIQITAGERIEQIPLDTLKKLVSAFKTAANVNFAEICFTTKFLNLINHASGTLGTFYSTLKTFVPVLIETNYLYNPLTDNPDYNFKDTTLYKKAVEKNRVKEVLRGGALTVTLLTQLELCQELGMHNFVRFTPQFLYKFLIGYIYPESGVFPNANSFIYATSEETTGTKFKRVYKEYQYIALVREVREKMLDPVNVDNDEIQASLSSDLDMLQTYSKVSTLYYAIKTDYYKLTHYGVTACDNTENKVTVTQLNDWLKVAKLRRE